MKTSLKIVKGLGVARNGTDHWWLQRLTAIALVPMMIWLTMTLVSSTVSNESTNQFLSSKTSIVIFTILIITMLFHATLGVKTVVEDYIHSEKFKFVLIISINLLTWVTGIFVIFALLSSYINLIRV